jgi:2-oxoglutarate dehydrogenase E2 component (dihydrolipoamide succinyltransferase)
MSTPVKMPQMGESVVEGTIIKWLKSEGDAVETDEPLVEVSTDKVDTEIPSPISGTLVKVLVGEGDTVEVGTPLCEIDEGGQAAEAPKSKEAEPEPKAPEQDEAPEPKAPEQDKAPEPEKVPEQEEPRERPAAQAAPDRGGPPTRTEERARPGTVLSPLVRKLAREHDIDLSQVRGSGAGGRITKQDVLDHVDGKRRPAEAPPRTAETAKEAPPPRFAQPSGERDEVQALTHIRRRIAQHMLGSLQTSARAWNAIEVDMENIARLRTKVNPEFKVREGFSLTYLPFIARALTDALATHPTVNASVSDDLQEAVFHHYVNLGIAVATDYGLIVPVVKGAEGMTVVGIARTIRELADKARTKNLSPDDVGGSTFTITNPGPFGSYLSVPVINQPNVAILSTEAVEQRVVAVDGMIAVRHRTFLSMSWDHRLLDGSDAMQFLAKLKENLETWDFSKEVSSP